MKLKFLAVPALLLAFVATGVSAETDFDTNIEHLIQEVDAINADDSFDTDVHIGSTLTYQETLRRGAKNERVLELQKKLKELGFYDRALDADFGSGTFAAVLAFQRARGLTADGIAGPKTFAEIISFGEGYTLPPIILDDSCTDEYEPVCGYLITSTCTDSVGAVDSDCERVKQSTTYSNKCELRSAGATYQRDGACESTKPVEDDARHDYIKKMIERLENYIKHLEQLIDRIENKIKELESEL